MPNKRNESNLVVGVKQTLRMIEQNRVAEIYIAKDADFYVTRGVIEAAKSNRVPIKYVESKKKLGHLCGIDIGASTAGALKQEQ